MGAINEMNVYNKILFKSKSQKYFSAIFLGSLVNFVTMCERSKNHFKVVIHSKCKVFEQEKSTIASSLRGLICIRKITKHHEKDFLKYVLTI